MPGKSQPRIDNVADGAAIVIELTPDQINASERHGDLHCRYMPAFGLKVSSDAWRRVGGGVLHGRLKIAASILDFVTACGRGRNASVTCAHDVSPARSHMN